MEFISKDEFIQIQSSPDDKARDVTNEVLERLFNKAVETTLRSLPELISRLIEQQGTLHKITKDFFESNPNFTKYKNLVETTVAEVEAKNPEKDYASILDTAKVKIQNKIAILESAPQQTFNFGD